MKYTGVFSKGGKPQLIEEDIFKIIIPMPPQVTPQDKKEQATLSFCITPRSREEIQNHININDMEYFRKHYLTPLLKNCYLKMTISGKPTSSKQKYQLTDTGKKYIEKE